MSIGDTIQYTVEVDNKGLLPLGNTVVIDAPSGNLTYVANSTTLNGSSIPDNALRHSFPLAAAGLHDSGHFEPGHQHVPIPRQGQRRAARSATASTSAARPFPSHGYLAPPPTNGATVSLNFTDTNGVPASLYAVGANVFVTMTNAAGNTSSNSVQTISVTVDGH